MKPDHQKSQTLNTDISTTLEKSYCLSEVTGDLYHWMRPQILSQTLKMLHLIEILNNK